MEHSIISPSSFKRWSNCPASPSLSSLAEERPVHIAAKLGTILHDASESVLLERNKSSAFLGTVHKVTGDKIIIERRMLCSIDITEKPVYLVLENYVYGRITDENNKTKS